MLVVEVKFEGAGITSEEAVGKALVEDGGDVVEELRDVGEADVPWVGALFEGFEGLAEGVVDGVV